MSSSNSPSSSGRRVPIACSLSPEAATEQLEQWAELRAFLRLTTAVTDHECVLDITADDPDAAPVVALLTGSGPR